MINVSMSSFTGKLYEVYYVNGEVTTESIYYDYLTESSFTGSIDNGNYIDGIKVGPREYANYLNDQRESTESQVDHPRHYNTGKIEVIDVIEDWELNFSRGNVVKYVGRAGHKEEELEDLEKALWYLQREISRLKK